MILLIFSLFVSLLAIVYISQVLHGRRQMGALFAYVTLSLVNVQVAFVINYLSDGVMESGPGNTGLLVVTLSFAIFVAVAWLVPATPASRFNLSELAFSKRQVVTCCLLVLIPAWTYFALLGSVPLVSGIKAMGQGAAGAGALQQARLERDPYFSGADSYIPMQGVLELFRNVGTPILFSVTALYYARTKDRSAWPILLICVPTVLAAGQRWPLQYLVLVALLCILHTQQARGRVIARAGLFVLPIGVALTFMQGRFERASSTQQMIASALGSLMDRIFFGYARVPIESYYATSHELENQGGSTYLQSLAAIAPGPGVSYPVTFFNTVYGVDTGFTASPDFATELNINFGLPGVLIGSLLWAFLLTSFDLYFMPRIKTQVGLALFSCSSLLLGFSSTGGAVGSITQILMIVPLIFVITHMASTKSSRTREAAKPAFRQSTSPPARSHSYVGAR